MRASTVYLFVRTPPDGPTSAVALRRLKALQDLRDELGRAGGIIVRATPQHADLQIEVNRQKLADLRNNIARDVRTSWQDTTRAYERLSVTQQLREQASLAFDLAQARYNLGLGSIVEFSQAELQKTEADIADTDAKYQYRLTQIVLAYTISSPK